MVVIRNPWQAQIDEAAKAREAEEKRLRDSRVAIMTARGVRFETPIPLTKISGFTYTPSPSLLKPCSHERGIVYVPSSPVEVLEALLPRYYVHWYAGQRIINRDLLATFPLHSGLGIQAGGNMAPPNAGLAITIDKILEGLIARNARREKHLTPQQTKDGIAYILEQTRPRYDVVMSDGTETVPKHLKYLFK